MISISRRKFLSAMAIAGLGRASMSAWRANAEEPLLSHADQVFLGDQARAILNSVRLMPGQEKGKYRNLTPYEVHVPGGNMGYSAFSVSRCRDDAGERFY
jgi:hypothetical protein